jgi:hypothetical protein
LQITSKEAQRIAVQAVKRKFGNLANVRMETLTTPDGVYAFKFSVRDNMWRGPKCWQVNINRATGEVRRSGPCAKI